MKTTKCIISLLLAAMTAVFTISCKKESTPSIDYAAEGYSFRVYDGEKYVELGKSIQVKEFEELSILMAYEKHPGSHYPLDKGEAEVSYIIRPNENIAKVGTYQRGTRIVIGLTPVSVGKTTFSCSVVDKNGTQILSRLFNVEVTKSAVEYIDLGLSVLWATCNIGADSEEECGDFFSWGETATKVEYTLENYKYYDNGGSTLTKYNAADGKTKLESSDDAAVQILKNGWRMATPDEWSELLQTEYKWTTVKGETGVSFTGKTGGKMFLPAAGSVINTGLSSGGTRCLYFTNTIGTPADGYEGYLYVRDVNWDEKGKHASALAARCEGRPIRAVHAKVK